MKNLTTTYIVLFLVTFFTTCFSNNKELPTTITDTTVADMQQADSLMAKPKVIQVDKTVKILGTTYLINLNSQDDDNRTSVMNQPNINADKLYEYYFGDKVSVIEYAGEWLGILDSTFYDEHNNKLDTPIYQKVYIKKSATGTLDKLDLKKEELALLQNEYDDIAIRNAPFDTVQFEIISKDVFERCRKNAKSFLLQDTTVIKKKSGILKLPCENKTVVLKDNDTDSDDLALFTYIGQIKELNSYVISGSFWESGAYLLYDKTTGEQTTTFNDQFIISPNLKYIVDIWGNPYENTTEVTLYRISASKEISLIASYSFSKWTTLCSNYECGDDYFFENDNSICIRVTPMSLQGFGGNSKEHLAQYIRMKIMI